MIYRKEFATYEELEAFVTPLSAEDKWVLSIRQMPEGMGFSCEWQEHKTYVTYTGETFPDEIWITEKGETMLVQDMSEAHVRNTLRMHIRNERLMRDTFGQITDDTFAEMFAAMRDYDDDADGVSAALPAQDKVTPEFDSFVLSPASFAVTGSSTLQ